MRKKVKKISCLLALCSIIISTGVVANAKVWQGTLNGYTYNVGLFSTRKSSYGVCYEGKAQTRWDKKGRVYAYVEGVNGSNPCGRIGSGKQTYNNYGWAEVRLTINDYSLAKWHSSHRAFENGRVVAGSDLRRWIGRDQ